MDRMLRYIDDGEFVPPYLFSTVPLKFRKHKTKTLQFEDLRKIMCFHFAFLLAPTYKHVLTTYFPPIESKTLSASYFLATSQGSIALNCTMLK